MRSISLFTMRLKLTSASLYGILDLGYVRLGDAVPMARRMLAGGVGILQLRAKSESVDAIRKLAKLLAPVCRDSGVPLILNDHPQLVAETGADGVHVGQDDLPVGEVRRIVGPDPIIGLSTHSLAQALAASRGEPATSAGVPPRAPADGMGILPMRGFPNTAPVPPSTAKLPALGGTPADSECGQDPRPPAIACARPDYIGFGPLFATPTKPDYEPVGLGDVAEVFRRVELPVFCIGGIKLENLPEVVAAGARRAVIVSGILQSPDPAGYCAKCAEILPPSPAHRFSTPPS